mgnify:CR=1 FL=1|tara:strand:+ start:4494 stop:4817 length:324 start_codon:yes stop_codon:yes gene_type:complete
MSSWLRGGRCQISVLLGQEISVTNIARTLNCHRATIYRELKRNKKVTEYCPDKAQRACLIRRKTSAKYRISSKTIDFIRILIEIDWSPEQVPNVLKNCGVPVSHELF